MGNLGQSRSGFESDFSKISFEVFRNSFSKDPALAELREKFLEYVTKYELYYLSGEDIKPLGLGEYLERKDFLWLVVVHLSLVNEPWCLAFDEDYAYISCQEARCLIGRMQQEVDSICEFEIWKTPKLVNDKIPAAGVLREFSNILVDLRERFIDVFWDEAVAVV